MVAPLVTTHRRTSRRVLMTAFEARISFFASDVYSNEPRYGGLTPFGAAVMKECNRLGIIDLSHADLQTTAAALKVSTRPVIISHTGFDTQLGNNPRLAEMMRKRLIG